MVQVQRKYIEEEDKEITLENIWNKVLGNSVMLTLAWNVMALK